MNPEFLDVEDVLEIHATGDGNRGAISILCVSSSRPTTVRVPVSRPAVSRPVSRPDTLSLSSHLIPLPSPTGSVGSTRQAGARPITARIRRNAPEPASLLPATELTAPKPQRERVAAPIAHEPAETTAGPPVAAAILDLPRPAPRFREHIARDRRQARQLTLFWDGNRGAISILCVSSSRPTTIHVSVSRPRRTCDGNRGAISIL